MIIRYFTETKNEDTRSMTFEMLSTIDLQVGAAGASFVAAGEKHRDCLVNKKKGDKLCLSYLNPRVYREKRSKQMYKLFAYFSGNIFTIICRCLHVSFLLVAIAEPYIIKKFIGSYNNNNFYYNGIYSL